MTSSGWSLSELSDGIRQQGERRRTQQEEELKVLEDQLPKAAEQLKQNTTSDLLLIWEMNRQASYRWTSLRRTKAVHRLVAYLCRKEILRRCGGT